MRRSLVQASNDPSGQWLPGPGMVAPCHDDGYSMSSVSPADFGGEKGPEGVAHHRQFAGVGGIEGFFHGARMGAMRDALGMAVRELHFDALSCFVVTGHVVEHFVGVQIGVVVWNLDGFLMEVQRAGAEGANHKVVGFSKLVGRGHVVLAHDWTEVIDIEGVRVVTPIPPHDIQRVVVVDVFVDAVSGLDDALQNSRTRQKSRRFRTAQVTFAIRHAFEELAGLLRM